MTDLLRISNLDVIYGGTVQAVRNFSCVVSEGQIVALLGGNGAGKTSTLKAISGLLPYENGKAYGDISFEDRSIISTIAHKITRRGLFHCREGRQIFDDLSVEDNLTAALGSGRGSQKDIDAVYDFFPRLLERKTQLAGYLSGGEQQMLAIGRALISRPKLILLDEPSMGLAPMIVEEIFSLLQRIAQERKLALLIVEQNARVALQHASYGYIMEDGQIVLEGERKFLTENEDVQEAYLGVGAANTGGQKSFRFVKHYRKSRRWLS